MYSPDGIVEQVGRALRGAWDFIVPPGLRLLIAVGLAALIFPFGFSDEFQDGMVEASVTTSQWLELLGLMWLLPLGVLVGILVVARTADSVFQAIGSLVPLRIQVYGEAILANEAHLLVEFWRRNPTLGRGELFTAVSDLPIVEDSNGPHAIEVKALDNEIYSMRGFQDYIKFLLVWSLAWCVVSVQVQGSLAALEYGLVCMVVIVLLGVLLVAWAREAEVSRRLVLLKLKSRLECGTGRASESQIDTQAGFYEELQEAGRKKWWSISMSGPPIAEVFRGFRLLRAGKSEGET